MSRYDRPPRSGRTAYDGMDYPRREQAARSRRYDDAARHEPSRAGARGNKLSGYGRYDYGRGDPRRWGDGPAPDPFVGWYPGAFWAGPPMFGWGALEGGWGWPPYAPVGAGRYGADLTPRRPPRESPAYGRGGDEEARRWAERYGYDIEYSIRPHQPRRRR